ncbi:MAG: DUF799 domain-containing protein [Gammaproteobacteria bacterium]|nr:DUF799 domain-containing protein [Gammaproteobacteria bacterium]MBU1645368.1 DUF799 domain-containing protein [Gammaproteobacteria bacterium]MBU1972361.1 DUF799 domain-containing protein [Gammaproteobacteria bacterium]
MRSAIGALAAVVLSGCVAQPVKTDMSAFQAAAPRSILIVPMVNKSLDVDAPNYVLTTVPVPLAEKGYYVFPVNTTKMVLEQEGFYEADRVHSQPPATLAKLFDADAVLYVTINRWDAKYVVIATQVTVEFEYHMFSRDGTKIWSEVKHMQWQPDNNSSGSPLAQLLTTLVSAAIARAAPNYMPLAQQANRQVFVIGPNAIPDGPYRAALNQKAR